MALASLPGKNRLESHNAAQVVPDAGPYSSAAAYISLESGHKGQRLNEHSTSTHTARPLLQDHIP